MGGRGSSSGGSTSKEGRFSVPEMKSGSDKQKAWAERILKGFDDGLYSYEKQAKEMSERLQGNKEYAALSTAYREARTAYRQMVKKESENLSDAKKRLMYGKDSHL